MGTASWQGPPTDVLGRAVPIQQFVARTEHTVVALQHLVAFPEGCILTLHLAVRRGALDDSAWKGVMETHFGADLALTVAEGGLKFGVRFPDGSRATAVEHAFPGWAPPSDRPERPMLVEAGSETSGNDEDYHSHHQLWLWPLPPPVPFELVVEWHEMGLDRASITLDGSAIARAAKYAQPFWA